MRNDHVKKAGELSRFGILLIFHDQMKNYIITLSP